MYDTFILRRYVSGSVYDLESLAEKIVNCTNPIKFNDPVDSFFYFVDEERFKNSKEILTNDIIERIRICCFVDYEKISSERKGQNLTANEILMWTHYANAHNGLCFEYSIPRQDFEYLEPKDSFN